MQGDAGPLGKFKEYYLPIYQAFEKEFEKQGTFNDAVLAASFKGWCDQGPTKQGYEENYILTPMHSDIKRIMQKQTERLNKYDQNVSSEEIVAVIGWTKNGNYLAGEDPKFLDGENFISIGERTKKDAQDFFEIRKEKTGIEIDNSVASMPTHKDAFARRLPEMGKPRGDVGETMSMGGTIDKWNAVLASKNQAKLAAETAKTEPSMVSMLLKSRVGR